MGGKNEPTAIVSRPDDVDLSRGKVEEHIQALNTILHDALQARVSTDDLSDVPEADTLQRAFELLQQYGEKYYEHSPLSEFNRNDCSKVFGSRIAPVTGGDLALASLHRIADVVFILGTSGSIVYYNKAAEDLGGKTVPEEVIGKNITEVISLINEQTMEPCERFPELLSGNISSIEQSCILVRKDESDRTVAVRGVCLHDQKGKLIGVLVLIRDITQQEQMEEELLKVRKLESIGLLAGGIAHDFNNILTGIITNLFMARMSVFQNEEACQLIADAEKAAFKATRLTKQLLTFSQGGAPVKEHIVVSQLIEETVGFSLSGSNVDYRLHFTDDLWTVEVDKGQIDQVLNNLVINAAQAMPEGGTVTISAENYTLDSDTRIDGVLTKGGNLPLGDGNYVRIMVRDEGPGIPRKHIGRIFDPYFTTRHGCTGLGLTTAYSILKKHTGHLEVDSQFWKWGCILLLSPCSCS